MTASTDSKTDQHFASIATAPPDSILGLTEAFHADPNPNKMNLTVGVYKDASGQTPVLQCVKAAERKLLETEATKGYLPIDGIADYRDHARKLVFGDQIEAARIAVMQTPGGTGGLRVAGDFLATQIAPASVWVPTPTWANHVPVFESAGLNIQSYRYLSSDRTSLDADGMIEDLQTKAAPGDVVLLHACCHNPTGIDPNDDQWKQIAEVVAKKRLLPLIDFAYQGFGRGLDEDASGLHQVLALVDEALVCSSFSKNFGLYSERVGALSVVTAAADRTAAAMSQLKRIVRTNYSNPPRHGGSIVATVLDDTELTALWHQELAVMRTRITDLRHQFVDTMKSCGHDFSFLQNQQGMFSYSGLTPLQVDELKSKHSIYIVGSGRINVAGMSEDRMQWLCEAVASVL